MFDRLLKLGTAALVAGCGDGPATQAGGYRSPAAWSSFIHATAEGPLLLEVHGDPFHLPPDEFRRAVAAAMTGAIPARPFQFTLSPEQAAHPRFRVVVAFDPPPGLDAAALCAGQAATAAKASDRVSLLAAFCQGDAVLASVAGWVAKVAGPEDARFRRLMGQAVRDLMGEP
jgi:hypothetical protein